MIFNANDLMYWSYKW